MRTYSVGGCLTGLVLTAVIGAAGWLLVGQGILEGVERSNERSAGSGPEAERMVSPRRLGPLVRELRRATGGEIRGVVAILRPLVAEFVVERRGRPRGFRFDADDPERGLRPADPEALRSGVAAAEAWPLARLDPRAPQRIARSISRREGGDFLLSLGTFERAGSGRLVWVLRGRIGERGVAYWASPAGRRVRPYDPSSPALSRGARIGECLRRAGGDPERIARCAGG